MFKQHPKAKVVGSNASYTNGDIVCFKIADLETSFTGHPDKRETQRIRIIPDILIKPSIKAIKIWSIDKTSLN